MLKLVSFHVQAHLNAFLQILEYFSQICLGPLARESPCVTRIKVKCTLVQALRLCTGRTAHRGSTGVALFFLDHSTRKRLRGQRHAPVALYPGKDPVPLLQDARWAPGPILTGTENLASTGIRSPDRPDRSQSLYRLHYPAHI